MNKLQISNYNLYKTLLGGQSFSWDLINDTYWGIHRDTVIQIKEKDGYWLWQTYPKKDNFELIKEYFRLDVDFEYILKEINKDEYIDKAINHNPNLRLLNMDLEQTIISFILSSNRNIPSIRKNIRNISELLGKEINIDGNIFFTFPTIEDIANCSLEDLRKTGIGYRAEYIKDSSTKLLNSNVLEDIKKYSKEKNEDMVRELLTSLNGIGNKVADCIMCYSLCFDNITPLDVWGKRFCNIYYGINTNNYINTLRWLQNYFGKYTGWAGQYLFEYVRGIEERGEE